jgi:hypothetical protein
MGGEDLGRDGRGDVVLKLHARQAENLLQDLLVLVLSTRRLVTHRSGLVWGGRGGQPCELLQALHLRQEGRDRRGVEKKVCWWESAKGDILHQTHTMKSIYALRLKTL